MGAVLKFPAHKLRRCGPECEGCWYCDGGLAVCVTCGGAEASLPTECPQRLMSESELNYVQRGMIDYTVARGWFSCTEVKKEG